MCLSPAPAGRSWRHFDLVLGPPACLCWLQTSGLSTKQLRQEAAALGMDCSWCLERSELLEAYKRAKQVGETLCRTWHMGQQTSHRAALPCSSLAAGTQACF